MMFSIAITYRIFKKVSTIFQLQLSRQTISLPICGFLYSLSDPDTYFLGKYSSKYIPFNVEVDKRRLQAKKSIVVQVQSHKSSNDLFNYCSNFGAISKMYHYTNSTELLVSIIY